MKILLQLDKALRGLNNVALSLAGLGMFFIALISTADVVTYLVIGKPFQGASESVEVALATTVAMTLAYAQYRRDHIVVDVLLQEFPAFGKWLSSLGALIAGLLCMILLSWRAWVLAIESVEVQETASTLYSFPIYPWKLLFAAGITLAAIECLRQIVWMLAGDPNGGAGLRHDQMESAIE